MTSSSSRELFSRGRDAWPGVEVEPDDFTRYVRDRLARDEDLEAALGSAHIEDLYLACACAQGNPRALEAFERDFLSNVPSFVRTVDESPAFADEVKQLLRKKLFVSETDSRAKILDYTGTGPLGGWLRVAAIRTARDQRRSSQRRAPIEREHGIELRPPAPDPELQYLKSRYASEFRDAFHATLSGLSAKERNVLCLYFLDGMSSTRIGALYKVEGATVRFWLKKSRENILNEMRRLLSERLRIDASELESLIVMVQSQLDLSISKFLRETAAI